MSEIRDLTDPELDVVSGGMTDCDMMVAQIYHTASIALGGLGQPLQGVYYDSKATDALNGQSCHGN